MPERLDDIKDFNNQGEVLDPSHQTALNLAFQAVGKFPDLAKKYRVLQAGEWVTSAALIGLASLAVYTKLNRGKTPEEVLEEITAEDIEKANQMHESKLGAIKRHFKRNSH